MVMNKQTVNVKTNYNDGDGEIKTAKKISNIKIIMGDWMNE